MRKRCTLESDPYFKEYGGRGIKVCERWNDFNLFLQDMGERPTKFTIERKNNDGNYDPSNCRWASRKEQSQNQRRTRFVEFNGERHLLTDLAKQFGIHIATLTRRIGRMGWPIERALTEKLKCSR